MIGTSGGSGSTSTTRPAPRSRASLSFADGDDDLFFFANSTVTGSINGGAGNNNLTLEGAAGTSDTLAGSGDELPDADQGRPRALDDHRQPERASRSTRHGRAPGHAGADRQQHRLHRRRPINPAGTLEARAQSLPTQSDPANNLNNIRNNGLLRFAQTDTGTYVGQIVGTGVVEKTGAGVTDAGPVGAGGNTYAGGTNDQPRARSPSAPTTRSARRRAG